jgi:DNA-binding CsgD family transcriptional regulator
MAGIPVATLQSIEKKIKEIDSIADDIPGVIIIHNVKTTEVEYMSPRGLSLLDTTLPELKAMGAEYHSRYFNTEESKEYVPKIFGLIERNNNEEILSFLQQVRIIKEDCWKWHHTSIKILMRDEDGSPLLIISVAIPVDMNDTLSIKATRLLNENIFLRKNIGKFQSLTQQEKKILQHLAVGKSSGDIAEALHISVHTADTHRRNIRRKLEANTVYELAEYARAFDLI